MASGTSKLSYSSLQDNTTVHLPGDPTYYVMEETSRGLKKNRHRSLSSMSWSAYSDNPNNLKSPSSVDRTCRSSASTKSSATLENRRHFDYTLPSLAPSTSRRIPAAKNNNSSPYSQCRGWNFSWQWSRMRKSITRENNGPSQKIASEANHSPSQAISSNDNLREEIDPMSLADTRHTAFNFSSSNRNWSHYCNREKTSHFEDEKQSGISLGNKYQPKSFQDIVGQEINMKVLYGAVQKKKVSQLYLFHGPSGTGKTSAAVIFAMALLCESSLLNTPCWTCRGCSRSIYTMELCSGSRTAGFQKISTLIQCTSFAHAIPGYKVFIIEESHLLTAQAWDELLGILENTCNASLVFVLITADANMIPESVSSRCQKFCFPRLRSFDVNLKLERIIGEEGIQIEEEALKLIVAKAQGSLREAEHVLDQLTLLGPRVTSSMVQQLLGLVPKNELISLLTAAIYGDTKTTIMTARELVAGGVEAEAIVLHLVSLITDILTGTDITTNPSDFAVPSKKQKSLANTPSQILCYALKVLLEAEKQPRSSIDQVTWVYSALLQIASLNCSDEISSENSFSNRKLLPLGDTTISHSISIASHSSEGALCVQQSPQVRGLDTSDEGMEKTGRCKGNGDERHFNLASLTNVGEIWLNILERIRNKDMKEFLSNHAKLASLTVSHANSIVHLMFNRTQDKMAAQISEESICNALEMAIGCPIVVNISSEPADLGNIEKCLAGCNQFKVLQPKSFLPELVDNANSRASMHQNRYNAAGLSSVKESKALTVSRSMKQENRLGSYAGCTTYSLQKDQFPEDATHMIRREEPQHKWLSISSFQNDANIEPYSQDILFENEKTANRRRATVHSKLKKDSTKVPEVHHLENNQERKGILRSWSCKELLCQKTKK